MLPIPISNKLIDEKNNHHLYSFLNKIPLSGILLSGGNDLGSFPDRDNTELNLINYAIQKSIPILGICRGMQAIAQWAGVGLKKVNGHSNSNHLIKSPFISLENGHSKISIIYSQSVKCKIKGQRNTLQSHYPNHCMILLPEFLHIILSHYYQDGC